MPCFSLRVSNAWILTTCLIIHWTLGHQMIKRPNWHSKNPNQRVRRSWNLDEKKSENLWYESSGDGPGDWESLKNSPQFQSPSSVVHIGTLSEEPEESESSSSTDSLEWLSRTSVLYPGPSSAIESAAMTPRPSTMVPSNFLSQLSTSELVPSFHLHSPTYLPPLVSTKTHQSTDLSSQLEISSTMAALETPSKSTMNKSYKSFSPEHTASQEIMSTSVLVETMSSALLPNSPLSFSSLSLEPLSSSMVEPTPSYVPTSPSDGFGSTASSTIALSSLYIPISIIEVGPTGPSLTAESITFSSSYVPSSLNEDIVSSSSSLIDSTASFTLSSYIPSSLNSDIVSNPSSFIDLTTSFTLSSYIPTSFTDDIETSSISTDSIPEFQQSSSISIQTTSITDYSISTMPVVASLSHSIEATATFHQSPYTAWSLTIDPTSSPETDNSTTPNGYRVLSTPHSPDVPSKADQTLQTRYDVTITPTMIYFFSTAILSSDELLLPSASPSLTRRQTSQEEPITSECVDSACLLDPTPSEVPPVQIPSEGIGGTALPTTSVTDAYLPTSSLTLTSEQPTALSTSAPSGGLESTTTTMDGLSSVSINLPTSFSTLTLEPIATSLTPDPSEGSAALPPTDISDSGNATADYNVTDAEHDTTVAPTTESTSYLKDENFWIRTVIDAEPRKWLPYVWDELPNRLARVYLHAFHRKYRSDLPAFHRERRQIEAAPGETSISVMLIGWSVNLSENHMELLYTVTKDGVPVQSEATPDLLSRLTKNELQKEIGFPVIIAAEPYQKGLGVVVSSAGRQWVILVAVGVTGASLALLICGALAYYRCCRKPDPLLVIESEPTSPSYGRHNVQRLLQEGVLSLDIRSTGESKLDEGDLKRPLPEVPESSHALKNGRSNKKLGTFLETPRNEGTQTDGGVVNLGFEDETADQRKAGRKPIKKEAGQLKTSSSSSSSEYFDHVTKPSCPADAATLPSQASLDQTPNSAKERKKRASNKIAASPPSVVASEMKTCSEINRIIDETIAATSRFQATPSVSEPIQGEKGGTSPRVVWTVYKANPDGTATPLTPTDEGDESVGSREPLFVQSDRNPSNLDYTVRSAEPSGRPLTAPEPSASHSGRSKRVHYPASSSDPHLVEAVKDELDAVSALRVKEPTQSVIKAIKDELKKFNTSLPGMSPESSA